MVLDDCERGIQCSLYTDKDEEMMEDDMPKELEEKLKKRAAKKFPKDKERQNAYTYGSMRKTGWKPSSEEK